MFSFEARENPGVFLACTGLEEVVVESGVKEIGDYCFAQCTALKRAEIPGSVKSIGKYAFMKGKSASYEKGEEEEEAFDFTLEKPIAKLPKLTIYGEKGSAVQTYAKKNSIPFSILPTGVTIKQGKSANVLAGEKLTLTAVIAPKGATTKLTWSSSNEKVAKVTQKGVVSALKKGSATITVKTTNGLKATCKITVPTPPRKVQFARKSYTVKVGKTVKLGKKLTPSGAKTTFTWSSSDKKIATVTSKGVVKGLKKGSATITVKTANGLKATVKVTVE